MKLLRGLVLLAGLALTARAQPNLVLLTNQHTDFRILYVPNDSVPLGLVARDEDAHANYRSNEVVLVAGESSRLTLPAGTPFGNEGDDFWILPQSQNTSLLYLGFSAEGLPAGIFSGPLDIRLKSVVGPGHFFAWQATTFGVFDIRMNTADGITSADKTSPIIGSHEHFNWGFSTSGVYRVTLQVSGTRVGEAQPISSAETTFVFRVLPLRPFEQWQATNWLNTLSESVIGPGADPDGDDLVNAAEYAFGLNPTNNLRTNLPFCSIVSVNGSQYGALTFTRMKSATDISFEPMVSSELPIVVWQLLTNVLETIDLGAVERVTVRDDQAVAPSTNRFYRLRLGLQQ